MGKQMEISKSWRADVGSTNRAPHRRISRLDDTCMPEADEATCAFVIMSLPKDFILERFHPDCKLC